MRLAIGLMLGGALAGAQNPLDCGLVSGWQQKGPMHSYVGENLFEYINGNAEGYLIYRFQKMTGLSCQAGEDTVVIDISEMADPESAYGLFLSNRDVRQPVEKIGMMAQILPRRATFVKDKYFVELSANPAKDHRPALRAFVTGMEKRIAGRTALPDAISWLPVENLDKDSIRLVPESVLGIRILKRGYVAQYDGGARAFLVPEASVEEAVDTMKKFQARLGQTEPVKLGEEAFQATDRYLGRLCVFRKGRFVGGFANFKEASEGLKLAAALASSIP